MTGKVFEELERARGTTGSGRRMTLADAAKRSAEESPAFAEALLAEEGHRAACRELRGRLKAARTDQKVTQAELAQRLGMSQSAVARLESGSGDIGFLTMRRYLSALDLEPSVVFAEPAGASKVRASEGTQRRTRVKVDAQRYFTRVELERGALDDAQFKDARFEKVEVEKRSGGAPEALVAAVREARVALRRAEDMLKEDAQPRRTVLEGDRSDRNDETSGGSS